MSTIQHSPVDPNENVCQLWTEIGVGERHFRDLQNRYRTMASTWLLASLGAMGYVASAQFTFIPKEQTMCAIALAGSTGIQLLWMLDTLVYHRLLNSYWIEGYSLEHDYRYLPQVRHKMRESQPDSTRFLRLFYAGCAIVPILFGIWTLGHWVDPHNWSPEAIIIASFNVIALAGVTFLWLEAPDHWQKTKVDEIDEKPPYETSNSSS